VGFQLKVGPMFDPHVGQMGSGAIALLFACILGLIASIITSNILVRLHPFKTKPTIIAIILQDSTWHSLCFMFYSTRPWTHLKLLQIMAETQYWVCVLSWNALCGILLAVSLDIIYFAFFFYNLVRKYLFPYFFCFHCSSLQDYDDGPC
jgi:cobalamin synthase